MRDDIEPVEIPCRADPPWWDFEITPLRLIVMMGISFLLGVLCYVFRIFL